MSKRHIPPREKQATWEWAAPLLKNISSLFNNKQDTTFKNETEMPQSKSPVAGYIQHVGRVMNSGTIPT